MKWNFFLLFLVLSWFQYSDIFEFSCLDQEEEQELGPDSDTPAQRREYPTLVLEEPYVAMSSALLISCCYFLTQSPPSQQLRSRDR